VGAISPLSHHFISKTNLLEIPTVTVLYLMATDMM
jgi:hypothetical protein